jgi:tRNA-2-methylthio-N6-dimethylallyladenosine synthase
MKYYVKTFGCQMNVHDSEKIAGILSKSGLDESDSKKADVIVLNTCSIREKAEQKFYSELGRLKKIKKYNPDLKIAVAGCIAQQRGKSLFNQFPYVDFVLGPNNIDSLEGWIDSRIQNTELRTQTTALNDNPVYHTKILPAKREGQVRAWVSIMYGCDNFCAYCVVPYTRGREVSRSGSDIYSEIKELADKGFIEVTLLGQNVNSYGKSLSQRADFPDLLVNIHGISGIKRIRFVTSHPRDFSERLISAINNLSRVCEHLHLPLQAGSDNVLNLMNRGYTYNEYKRKINDLRKAVPGIAITTDIITGFPGETDNDFQKTIDALREIEFDGIFAFKYSRRPGTKALDLPDHIDEKIKSERLAKVLDLQETITCQKNKALEGEIVEILVEGASENNHDRLKGRTRTNKIVNFVGNKSDIGKLTKVKILKAGLHSLFGERIPGF